MLRFYNSDLPGVRTIAESGFQSDLDKLRDTLRSTGSIIRELMVRDRGTYLEGSKVGPGFSISNEGEGDTLNLHVTFCPS